MMLHSQLLSDAVQLAADQHLLVINSAADPFVLRAAQQLHAGQITLAEDNIATLPVRILSGRQVSLSPRQDSQFIASLSNTTANEGKQNSVHPYRHIPF